MLEGGGRELVNPRQRHHAAFSRLVPSYSFKKDTRDTGFFFFFKPNVEKQLLLVADANVFVFKKKNVQKL